MQNRKEMKITKYIKDVLIALIPALLVLILILTEPFYGMDSALSDLVYSQMNGTGEEIVLICVDEETLSEYGPFADWSREKSAELLDKLYEDEENAPVLTAFDFMFIGEKKENQGLTSEEQPKMGITSADQRLYEAVSQEGRRVVLASNLVYRGRTAYGFDGSPYYDIYNIEGEELPFEPLNSVAKSGFANADISKDGFVRTARLYSEVEGTVRYSFAAQIFLTYTDGMGKYEDALKEVSGSAQVQFFYSGKPGEFTHYSMKDVLSGAIPAQAFANRIVMVGAYASGMQDSYHNTAKRGQDMYGVEINANIVQALLNGKTATRVRPLYVALVAAILLFLYTFLSRQMKMYPALLMNIWIVMLDLILGRMLAVRGKIISLVYPLLVLLLIMIGIVVEKYVLEIFKKKKVLNSFKKYLAPQVIEKLSKDEQFTFEIGGEKRQVAVLFVDIRGFTSLSEKLNPEEIVKILNRYLTLTSSCIFEHDGMLDKFIGDATMAIFNAPNDQEDYVYQAVLAGMDMQKKGEELGTILEKEFGKKVSFGVGIHMGEAIVGNIGSQVRMDYTAIGDTVNTASRIESKSSAGEVLISEAVYRELEGRIVAEFKEDMLLKGKEKPVSVYKVLGVLE